MRIMISPDWERRWVLGFPGGGDDERQRQAEHAAATEHAEWYRGMSRHAGSFVPVNTGLLFCDRFNTQDGTGTSTGIQIHGRYVDAIDFAPEFADVDDYMSAALNCWGHEDDYLRNGIQAGTIKDATLRPECCTECRARLTNCVFLHEPGCPNALRWWDYHTQTWRDFQEGGTT